MERLPRVDPRPGRKGGSASGDARGPFGSFSGLRNSLAWLLAVALGLWVVLGLR